MNKLNIKQVRNTMKCLAEGCRDRQTGEINYTMLAESAACELNLYVGDDIPDEVFELALEYK